MRETGCTWMAPPRSTVTTCAGTMRENACIEAILREAIRRGRRTVALVERRDHLATLSRRLKEVRVRHAAVSGQTPVEERREVLRLMSEGKLSLILATRVFGKGVDVPTLDCVVDATGLPSRNNALQRYGRGTRVVAGKELIHVDIADRKSPFSGAADARLVALRETGSEIETIVWNGDASKIF